MQGETYDVIYFDTSNEDYSELRKFFTDLVPRLLDSNGRFSFFHGFEADRRVCYDVHTKLVEMHTEDAGLDIEWDEIDMNVSARAETGKGGWEGVSRKHWTIDSKDSPPFTQTRLHTNIILCTDC